MEVIERFVRNRYFPIVSGITACIIIIAFVGIGIYRKLNPSYSSCEEIQLILEDKPILQPVLHQNLIDERKRLCGY